MFELGARSIEGVPAWARAQLEGLVAAVIVRRATGQDALYHVLKEEADTLIEYYELDPDAVYGMYGDPADPAVQERARERLEEGSFISPGSYLGVTAPDWKGAGDYGICKIKNVDPGSEKRGTVNGFIYVAPKSMLLRYVVGFFNGQFRMLYFDEECIVVDSFDSVVMSLDATQVASDIRALCVEDVDWDTVIDAVLSDIRGVSRGEARKRMAEGITEHRDRCFR